MAIKDSTPTAPTIHWRIEQWFPDLGADKFATLKKYHEELLRFQKTINLIGEKTIPVADALHFADSILASRLITRGGAIASIHDFGSGNGFPGIVIGILNPTTQVHLVEIDARKSEFLKHLTTALRLPNVHVLRQEIEALPAGSVNVGVSRGLAAIPKALLMTRKVFAPGGTYYHMKSEEWAGEVAGIPSQLCTFWLPSLLGEYKLPVGEITFAVVKTERLKE